MVRKKKKFQYDDINDLIKDVSDIIHYEKGNNIHTANNIQTTTSVETPIPTDQRDSDDDDDYQTETELDNSRDINTNNILNHSFLKQLAEYIEDSPCLSNLFTTEDIEMRKLFANTIIRKLQEHTLCDRSTLSKFQAFDILGTNFDSLDELVIALESSLTTNNNNNTNNNNDQNNRILHYKNQIKKKKKKKKNRYYITINK